MLIAAAILSIVAAQPLQQKDIKEFRESFVILNNAHQKGKIEILAKYGPRVLSDFDLLTVTNEPGDKDRNSYDSLSLWVRDAEARLQILGALDSIRFHSPSAQASALALLEGAIPDIPDAGLRERALKETETVAKSTFRQGVPLDTLFAIRKILPDRLARAVNLQVRLNTGLDDAYRDAFNEGADALTRFAYRFPGVRTSEVDGALAFAEIDDLNSVIRSKSREGLLKLYKEMGPSKQRNDVAKVLEKIFFDDWQAAKLPDVQLRAARDFLEIFRQEPKKSAKFLEVENWLYISTTAPVQPMAIAPATQPAQSIIPGYTLPPPVGAH